MNVQKETWAKFHKAKRLIAQDFRPKTACQMANISYVYFNRIRKHLGETLKPGRPTGSQVWRDL